MSAITDEAFKESILYICKQLDDNIEMPQETIPFRGMDFKITGTTIRSVFNSITHYIIFIGKDILEM